ncbi:unnamed protein product [Pseudo-nitzschia multistriata]|uniref:Thioredoxin domain-containing protein n=1 Tax=Pseudo-nitzschia multistriata TaxID=183589 RepID=A0A448YY83_9STRA|nr:unnamed protein product [Pseudo-nitzschia multistriata]
MMAQGGRRPWQSHIDMYRKIPTDLMEGTGRGSILSYLSLLLMAVLFLWESKAYFTSSTVTDLALDKSDDRFLRLNFNITMTDLKCDWAVIDVVSVLGTDQNVTAHLTKWNLDGEGVRKGYKGRNRNQKDIEMFDSSIEDTLEDLHEDGVDAIPMDEATLEHYKRNHDYVFVDFFASWCSHCQALAPTWEVLAEIMADASANAVEDKHDTEHEHFSDEEYEHALKVNLPVVIGKVDCVVHKTLCNQKENIRAYPTLRLFVDGKQWESGSDYNGHRTIMEMVDWLKFMEDEHKSRMENNGAVGEATRKLHAAHDSAKEYMEIEDYDNLHGSGNNQKRTYYEWKESEHPGCQLAGHLLLDRVPGNFHILARSKHHDLAPHLTNVSHQVHSLTIGDPHSAKVVADMAGTNGIPSDVSSKIAPMDGNVYTTHNLHESYHHYLKVVSTRIPDKKVHANRNNGANAYQIIPSSQLAYYQKDMVPEAKFVYDLSPISVTYRASSRRWYEYVTSLFAIIGGVFTIIGMVESTIHATVSKAKRRSTASNYPPQRADPNRY